MRKRWWIVAVTIWMAHFHAHAEPVLWGGLKAGPYRVGYTTTWTADETRRFDAKLPDGTQFAAGKTARPILVMKWYPAEEKAGRAPMVQGDYMALAPTTGKLHALAEALIQYSRDNVASEVADAEDMKKADSKQQAALHQYFSAPTAAYRDAPAKAGRYPLVIYLHGYGSSFEDNTALCEYLASNGFVVISSAFQSSGLWMISDYQEAGDDVQFLIHYGRGLAGVDADKVALVGHSGGAQTALSYASREGAMADAVVSLDTTEDYHYIDFVFGKHFLEAVNRSTLDVPILFVADPGAIFDMADSIKNSHRYYLTERDTEHDEFIDHGLARVIVLDMPKKADVAKKYAALCENVNGFLRTSLKLDGGASAAWPGAAKLDFEKQMVNLEEVPIGVTEPSSYSGGDISPTPRQFREMIFAGRYDEAIAAVSKFSSGADWNPLYDAVVDTVDHLLAVGQVEPARRMNAAYKEVNTAADIPGYFDSWGDRSILWGAKSEAILYYKRALDLKPDDPKAMEGLKKAEALPKHQDSAN